jgi:hypothetical protein
MKWRWIKTAGHRWFTAGFSGARFAKKLLFCGRGPCAHFSRPKKGSGNKKGNNVAVVTLAFFSAARLKLLKTTASRTQTPLKRSHKSGQTIVRNASSTCSLC